MHRTAFAAKSGEKTWNVLPSAAPLTPFSRRPVTQEITAIHVCVAFHTREGEKHAKLNSERAALIIKNPKRARARNKYTEH